MHYFENSRESLALNLLFHPEIYPGMKIRDADNIIFTLWCNDPLHDYVSWSLFKETENEYYFRKVTWEQRFIYKLKNPATRATERLLSHGIISSNLEEFASFDLKKFQNKKQGLSIDVIEYGIISNQHHISWDDNNLIEIDLLHRWYKDTVAKLNRLV